MDWIAPAAFIAALLGASTAAGLVWRQRQGRAVASRSAVVLRPSDLTADADGPVPDFGPRGTLVQFSTEFCSSCPATRRVLGSVAAANAGVVHLDIDVTHRADLVRRFSILQTPTTLILDRDGAVRVRIGGAVRRPLVEAGIQELS
ncbi:thioredoxin family protein [Herbiconiux sp. 11R-BC]|uniref:TlpA family protein disulfide reductase n=1 Tax=Herbiconiux sp. 11R-BC TaxID=3111637 RepID=UPI003BFE6C25